MGQKVLKISVFKAKCIETLRAIERDGESVVVTLRGKPIAIVQPIVQKRALGQLRGECEIHGDIVKADFDEEWEMNR